MEFTRQGTARRCQNAGQFQLVRRSQGGSDARSGTLVQEPNLHGRARRQGAGLRQVRGPVPLGLEPKVENAEENDGAKKTER